MRLKHEHSKNIVEKVWACHFNGSVAFRINKKLLETKRELKKWDEEEFRQINFKIKKSEEELVSIQSLDPPAKPDFKTVLSVESIGIFITMSTNEVGSKGKTTMVVKWG